jgi:hypothetical protein
MGHKPLYLVRVLTFLLFGDTDYCRVYVADTQANSSIAVCILDWLLLLVRKTVKNGHVKLLTGDCVFVNQMFVTFFSFLSHSMFFFSRRPTCDKSLYSPPVLQLIVKRRAGGHGTSLKTVTCARIRSHLSLLH